MRNRTRRRITNRRREALLAVARSRLLTEQNQLRARFGASH